MPPMQMMPQMGPPKQQEWSELVEQLLVQIANAEKNLLLAKAQLKEAQSHLDDKKEE